LISGRGGGYPTVVRSNIRQIFDAIRRNFDVGDKGVDSGKIQQKNCENESIFVQISAASGEFLEKS